MSTANLDEHDLRTDVTGADFINEDVLQQIQQIDRWPKPFLDAIGRSTAKKTSHEWTTIEKGSQNLANAAIDGADVTGNDTVLGRRVQNKVQIFTKRVPVSYGAIASDTIGRANERAFQMAQRMDDMMQDVEGVCLSNQPSVAPTESVAGKMGGLAAWIDSPTRIVDASGGAVDGGYNASTGIVDEHTVDASPGALTQTLVEDCAQAVYEEGGKPSLLMSTPTMIRKLSTFMFDSSARVATLTGNTGADSGSGALVAKAAVNVFITSFDVVLQMKPNRDQPALDALSHGGTSDDVDVFLIDPTRANLAVMRGMQAEKQGVTGLAENWQLSYYVTLEVLNEKAHGNIADRQSDVAVTA